MENSTILLYKRHLIISKIIPQINMNLYTKYKQELYTKYKKI